MNLNKILLAGNLTRKPELRYTAKGVAIAKFSIATNRSWKGCDGQKQEEVTFVECDAFGKTAETIAQYLDKGNPIFVEGRLRLDQWDDKQTGEKRQKLGVVVEEFQFVQSKGNSKTSAPAKSKKKSTEATSEEPADDDVPF
jgi:single-strand DNA-binding protein